MSKTRPMGGMAPKIFIDADANSYIQSMVRVHDTEVGFLGVVDKIDSKTYLIRDIFYPKHQLATGATCEISSEGTYEMAMNLMGKGQECDVPKVMFWGHSHVNMGVTPSSQDETQGFNMATEDGVEYFIRGIFNKKGDYGITLYDAISGVIFDELPLIVTEGDDVANRKTAEIRLAVEEIGNNRDLYDKINQILSEVRDFDEEVKHLKETKLPKSYAYSPNNHWPHGRSYQPANSRQPLGYKELYDELEDKWPAR